MLMALAMCGDGWLNMKTRPGRIIINYLTCSLTFQFQIYFIRMFVQD